MNIEIITIGEELLIGQVIDTNAAWIAAEMNKEGFSVSRKTTISDHPGAIKAVVQNAFNQASVVIMTGGLGPTRDDTTKNALCQLFDTHLIENKVVLKQIKAFLRERKASLNNANKDQAKVPEKAKILTNPNGTASGLWLEEGGKIVISLPGVPHEMKYLIQKEVIPRLKDQFNLPFVLHKTILTQGLFEAQLSELLNNFEDELPENVKLAYLPSPSYMRLRLSARGDQKEEVYKQLQEQLHRIEVIIRDFIIGYDHDTLEALIGYQLKKQGQTLATAESCTGGNIARLITSVPGSSNYFKGSIVAYSNPIKKELLKVSESNLKQHGAVSQQVVEQMAIGARILMQTDYAISTSGIAGPEGGTSEKPVGTVWIAVAYKNGVNSKKFHFGKDRERNIIRSSYYALNMLKKTIQITEN